MSDDDEVRVHEARCDMCKRLMYRANVHGPIAAQPDEMNKRPIKFIIGHHGFMLCSRQCLHAMISSLADDQLFEGGYPLPWGV